MLPLKADLPCRTIPVVTVTLILMNVFVYVYELSLGPNTGGFFLRYGAIPYELTQGLRGAAMPLSAVKGLFSSMFIHAGLLHVGGNMLYLWIFGRNVEDEMGHSRFLVFYFLTGVIAAYSHAAIDLTSRVPMVGASGAVSGILGAYFLLFPKAKILTLVPIGFFLQMIRIPAMVVLGFWVLGQFMYAFYGATGQGGVAWFAHVGGFVSGMILLRYFRPTRPRWRR